MKSIERMRHESEMQQIDLAHLILRLRELDEKVSSLELLSSSAIDLASRSRYQEGRARLAIGVSLERADEMMRRRAVRKKVAKKATK